MSGICKIIAPAIVEVAAPKMVRPIVNRHVSFSSETSSLAGKKRAVMELQQAVGVTADGVIGPKTMEAVNAQDLNDVILTLTAERLRFYTSLSTWSTYGKGWTNRVADNLKYAAQDN